MTNPSPLNFPIDSENLVDFAQRLAAEHFKEPKAVASADATVAPKRMMAVNKVNWSQVGSVTEPGRYMYTFGWLTITTEDLAVWRTYPTARFTLLSKGFSESAEEYRLGSFDPGGYGMNEAAA
jgi:hypothetical protein